MMDCEEALLLGLNPVLSEDLLDLPLPSQESSWNASSAEEWQLQYILEGMVGLSSSYTTVKVFS